MGREDLRHERGGPRRADDRAGFQIGVVGEGVSPLVHGPLRLTDSVVLRLRSVPPGAVPGDEVRLDREPVEGERVLQTTQLEGDDRLRM